MKEPNAIALAECFTGNSPAPTSPISGWIAANPDDLVVQRCYELSQLLDHDLSVGFVVSESDLNDIAMVRIDMDGLHVSIILAMVPEYIDTSVDDPGMAELMHLSDVLRSVSISDTLPVRNVIQLACSTAEFLKLQSIIVTMLEDGTINKYYLPKGILDYTLFTAKAEGVDTAEGIRNLGRAISIIDYFNTRMFKGDSLQGILTKLPSWVTFDISTLADDPFSTTIRVDLNVIGADIILEQWSASGHGEHPINITADGDIVFKTPGFATMCEILYTYNSNIN